MAQSTDLYELLGVPRTATDEEIRRAYLKLAHKYHPDKTGGDKEAEEKLKRINAAYDILKNPDKRKQYDTFGSTGPGMGPGGFRGGGGDFTGGFGGAGFDSPFDDFFEMLFGRGGGRRQASRPGNDIECSAGITLEEAAAGVKKKVKFSRMEVCSDCSGSGAAPGSKADACPSCQGSGQVRASHGFFSVTQTCPQCRGTGRIVLNPCRRCGGRGRIKISRELAVDIPAGVDTGVSLRLAGEGEPGENGGPRGDLHIHIEVEPHDVFQRQGTDILCDLPISFPQAALGATVRVPTLRGEEELKVPAGTQNGTVLRLRGLGMPGLRGYRQGDQLVRVVVEVPSRLTRRQKELLEEFERESDEKDYPLYRRFMETLKKLGR